MVAILKILKTKSTTLSDDLFLCQVSKGSAVRSSLFNPPKSFHPLQWIFLQNFMKFDERNPNFFKSPLFCFHGNCGKVCPTDSDVLGLSRSTRCGYCSYQVSPISVQRVICYDHFCVFQFFSILAVSMATATILKKSTLKSTTSHGI